SLSSRDRWWGVALIGGCAVVAAVRRAVRWWEYWGSVAKPYELIPTVCFGAGAGLVLGVLLYAAGVRVWRPASASGGGGGDGGSDGDRLRSRSAVR
ncbi:hypothetical protein OQI_21650, partial [Streptomyces pharetrae CZA14]